MDQLAREPRLSAFIPREPRLDTRLPAWARRSHPLVRRELGRTWRTMLPDTDFLLRVLGIQILLVILTVPLPHLVGLAMPAIAAAVLLFPLTLGLYGYVLFGVAAVATRSMTTEYDRDTLGVLRATPYSAGTILRSKAAAALWRQMEDLTLVLLVAVFLSLPILIWQYGMQWPLGDYPLISCAAFLLGLATSLLRLLVEPFMVGMLGLFMGAALRSRPAALMATATVMVFYFLFLFLLRYVPMAWPLRFVVDFALPLLLPLAVIWLTHRLSRRLLETA